MSGAVWKLWERYRRAFVPQAIDAKVELMLRRAYFFGAKDTMDFINAGYSGAMPPTESDCQLGREIHSELLQFAQMEFPKIMQERIDRHLGN